MRETEQRLREVMREAGLRNTLARRAICRVLAENSDGFLTAATILERVADTVGDVDNSTVYRTLNQLEKLGYMHYLQVSGQPGAWHLTLTRDHQHLICDSCGESQLVPLGEIAPLVDMIEERYDFRLHMHHFAFVGICGACRKTVQPAAAAAR